MRHVLFLVLAFACLSHAQPLYHDDMELLDSTCFASRPDNVGTENITGCGIWTNIHTPASGTGGTTALFHLEPHAAVKHSGNASLSILYSQDEEFAMARIPIDHDSIWFAQWIYFASGYDFTQGNKIARLDTRDGSGNIVYDYIVQVYSSTHGPGEDDMYGITFAKNGSTGGDINFGYADGLSWARNTWHHVECKLKLNDPGQSNGSGACWADSVKVLETTGLGGTLLRPSGSTFKLRNVDFGGWYSNGGQTPSAPSKLYFDDVAVHTARIGYWSGGSGGSCVTD